MLQKFEIWYPVKTDRSVLVSQGFGVNGEYYRKNGINIAGHNGWDMRAYHGQPVRAAHDGMVVYAGVDNKEGVGVVILTTEMFQYAPGTKPPDAVHYKSIYWHLTNNIPVKVGTLVKTGDIIGYADNTGFSTGNHLHFGLKPQIPGEEDWVWYNMEQDNGYLGAIDPSPYWNGMYAEDAQTFYSILGQQISALQKIVELWSKLFLR